MILSLGPAVTSPRVSPCSFSFVIATIGCRAAPVATLQSDPFSPPLTSLDYDFST
jgi:hypothetical protein